LPELKDSGIDWIGNIPKHWDKRKLKYISNLITESSETNNNDIKISPENIEPRIGICNNYHSEYQGVGVRFNKNDILLNKLRLYLHKFYQAKEKGFSMGEMIVIRPNKLSLSNYLKYIFHDSNYINFLDSHSYGIKMPRVSVNDIFSSLIPIPPSTEQDDISNYLDKKTEKINLLIENNEKKIELLEEQRSALISNLVTGKIRAS
tara:strand:- start:698 stop:1312 length:615 start_codon:yes stop_codon:yes gene_type:complete